MPTGPTLDAAARERLDRRAPAAGARARAPLRNARRAAGRPRAGRHARPDQGDRPLRPGRGQASRASPSPTILGEIQRHFRDRSWTVRVPRGLQEARGPDHRRPASELSAQNGRSPTVNEIAEWTEPAGGRGARRARRGQRPPRRRARLARLGGRRGRRDRGGPRRPRASPWPRRRAMLSSGLADLPARERVILHLRFEEGLTQSEIAAQRRHLPDARLPPDAAGARDAPREHGGDMTRVSCRSRTGNRPAGNVWAAAGSRPGRWVEWMSRRRSMHADNGSWTPS